MARLMFTKLVGRDTRFVDEHVAVARAACLG